MSDEQWVITMRHRHDDYDGFWGDVITLGQNTGDGFTVKITNAKRYPSKDHAEIRIKAVESEGKWSNFEFGTFELPPKPPLKPSES